MILAILQARMSSTRLPGKVLRPLAGGPMILRQVERLRRSRRIDRLVLATSDHRSDDVLAEVAGAAAVIVFRGDLDDVLARYIGAIDAFGEGAGHIVRLTGDCPLADPEVIDAVIARHLETGADYTANTWGRRTFPKGLDVDIVRTVVLREAGAEAVDPYEREHVLPFIYRRPQRYDLRGLTQAAEEGEVRWTVDRPDDLAFVSAVYDGLYAADPAFTSEDVRAFVRAAPNLATLGGEPRV
jgi:spore coat polysaccharide biosynthesis protein SpsF